MAHPFSSVRLLMYQQILVYPKYENLPSTRHCFLKRSQSTTSTQPYLVNKGFLFQLFSKQWLENSQRSFLRWCWLLHVVKMQTGFLKPFYHFIWQTYAHHAWVTRYQNKMRISNYFTIAYHVQQLMNMCLMIMLIGLPLFHLFWYCFLRSYFGSTAQDNSHLQSQCLPKWCLILVS